MKHRVGAIPSAAEVADRLAIEDVLATHSRGVDRADEASRFLEQALALHEADAWTVKNEPERLERLREALGADPAD